MTPDEFKRRFPNASAATIAANCVESKPVLEQHSEMQRVSFSADEDSFLTRYYSERSGVGINLNDLAEKMGRTKWSVAMRASRLGLCNQGRPKSDSHRESCSMAQREIGKKPEIKEMRRIAGIKRMQDHEHPRGFLGGTHSESTKAAISAAHLGKKVPAERVNRILKTKLEKYGTLAPPHGHPGASWKQGWREICGRRIYFRSAWEFNYALYLEMLRTNGDLSAWDHEPETFWFEKIRRGCRSYLPDFKITLNTGLIEYHEVKGWMDARSKTKIKRMAKYFPAVTLKVIGVEWFRANNRTLSAMMPGWEKKRKSTL